MREHETSAPKADHIEEHAHAIRLVVDGFLLARPIGFAHSHICASPDHTHKVGTIEWEEQ